MEEINEFKHFLCKNQQTWCTFGKNNLGKEIKNTQLPKSAIKRTHYKPTKKKLTEHNKEIYADKIDEIVKFLETHKSDSRRNRKSE